MNQTVDRKVTAGLVGGALMTIIAWIAEQFYHIPIPAPVALAGATVITYFLQLVIPNRKENRNVKDTDSSG